MTDVVNVGSEVVVDVGGSLLEVVVVGGTLVVTDVDVVSVLLVLVVSGADVVVVGGTVVAVVVSVAEVVVGSAVEVGLGSAVELWVVGVVSGAEDVDEAGAVVVSLVLMEVLLVLLAIVTRGRFRCLTEFLR